MHGAGYASAILNLEIHVGNAYVAGTRIELTYGNAHRTL
jgi:hypothetical protein